MNAACALGAAAAVAAASTAVAQPKTVPVYLGTFMNTGMGQIGYWGEFDSYVWSGRADCNPGSTLIGIDVAGILAGRGYSGFTGVSVHDTGLNAYGPLSPGADIDFIELERLSAGIGAYVEYDGPNPIHQGESPGLLGYRTREIDSLSGDQDAWDWTHLSLGELGRMDLTLTEPQWLIPDGEPGPVLYVSEAGSSETFWITAHAIIPGPGPLALLIVAAITAKPRRRR